MSQTMARLTDASNPPESRLRRLVRGGLLALMLALAPAAAQAVDVTGLRIGQHDGETRLVLDMTDTPAFRIESADARHFTLELPALESAQVPAASGPKGLISRIDDRHEGEVSRIGLSTGTTARINRAFYLPADAARGPRLVIDFAEIGAEEAARVGRQVYGSRPAAAGQATAVKSVQLPDSPASGAAPLPQAPAMAPAITLRVPLPPSKPPVIAVAARAPPVAQPDRQRLIVIDAGHGGHDPGATSVTGIHEKTLTLAVARELRRQLLLTGRYRVVLTRDRDRFLPLRGRVDRAQQARGDLFISLHADSIGRGQVRGLSIYTLSDRASDAETAALARRENRDTVINGVTLSDERADVANILIDLAMRDSVNKSNRLANVLLTALRQDNIRLLEQRPHRAAGFAVLKAVNMPSVLVEMGYLSHDGEARQLADKEYQARLSAALLSGIDRYFASGGTQMANR